MQQHLTRRLLYFSSSSSSSSNPAFAETSNLVRRPNIHLRRSSSAASHSSEPKRIRKRVSKDERKSMVESFVNKYRAMNSGKFPTASVAQKEVGGSYYLVRKVVQELQYESRMPSTRMRKESLVETEANKKYEPSTEFKDISEETQTKVRELMEKREVMSFKSSSIPDLDSSSQMKTEVEPVSSCLMAKSDTSRISDDYTNDASDMHLKESWSTSSLEEKTSFKEIGRSSETGDNSEAVAHKSDLLDQEAKCLHSISKICEDKVKGKTTSKDVLEFDGMKSKANQQQQSTKLEECTGDLSKEQRDDAESPKKSFTWSLKSLADGIINIWRKL